MEWLDLVNFTKKKYLKINQHLQYLGNSEYAEPYEPSALKGVAGLAVAGAGAVALRTPVGRAIKKITSLTTPKLPVSRIKEPVDEVEEVLTIAPTKVERGQLMTRPHISQQEQIRQEAIQKSNELKKHHSYISIILFCFSRM